MWKKNIVKTDYLIDDNPRQLQIFEGEPIIFTAAHNINETRFKRVNGWKDVEAMFLNNKVKVCMKLEAFIHTFDYDIVVISHHSKK